MGTKPSNNFQSDRPESGGADHHSERENSGLLNRNKQKFASDKAAERHNRPPEKHVGELPSSKPGGESHDREPIEHEGESAE